MSVRLKVSVVPTSTALSRKDYKERDSWRQRPLNKGCLFGGRYLPGNRVSRFRGEQSQLAFRYVSCIFAEPYDGPTPATAVLNVVQSLLNMGCYEVSLGDTLGIGTPSRARELVQCLKMSGIDPAKLAGHFHGTYGQALANVWEAYKAGIRTFDSSVAGLGGCPLAPGSKGNVATEDLAYLFQGAGIRTGIDLEQLVDVGSWISQQLGQQYQSRAGQAILSKRHSSSTPSHTSTALPKRLNWELLQDLGAVQVFRTGVNGKIVLDDPNRGNALSPEMISQIQRAFSSLE